MVYPHKWSPVSYRLSEGQGKFAGQRPAFCHCTNTGSQYQALTLGFKTNALTLGLNTQDFQKPNFSTLETRDLGLNITRLLVPEGSLSTTRLMTVPLLWLISVCRLQ